MAGCANLARWKYEMTNFDIITAAAQNQCQKSKQQQQRNNNNNYVNNLDFVAELGTETSAQVLKTFDVWKISNVARTPDSKNGSTLQKRFERRCGKMFDLKMALCHCTFVFSEFLQISLLKTFFIFKLFLNSC